MRDWKTLWSPVKHMWSIRVGPTPCEEGASAFCDTPGAEQPSVQALGTGAAHVEGHSRGP